MVAGGKVIGVRPIVYEEIYKVEFTNGGTYRNYLFLFGDSRTAYSDLSAKKFAAEKNLFICLKIIFPQVTSARTFQKIF